MINGVEAERLGLVNKCGNFLFKYVENLCKFWKIPENPRTIENSRKS